MRKTIFDMTFDYVYPSLIKKAESKGRSKEEVYAVTTWLTGYTTDDLERALSEEVSYGVFFKNSPSLNPDREYIGGSICGVKIQEIEDSTMKIVRQLDKLVDELAKGKSLEKIFNRRK